MGQWPIFRSTSLLLPQISASSLTPCIALRPPARLRSGLFLLISADRPHRLIGHNGVCKETSVVLFSHRVIQPTLIPVFPLSSPNPMHMIDRSNPLPLSLILSLSLSLSHFVFFLAPPALLSKWKGSSEVM